jgi:mitochondrial fission protein ELM1
MNVNDVKVDYNRDLTPTITVINGEFTGIQFRFGKVWFEDEMAEQPVMQFQYEVLSGAPSDVAKFQHEIAHLLHSLLVEQLESGTITYTGGVSNPAELAEKEALESLKPQETFAMPELGVFKSTPGQSAMSFLDQLAAEGNAAMKH